MIRHKAADVAREIKQNPLGPAFWAYLGLAFAYGVIHALGPGHGKVFVGTYFLTRNATLWQGVLAGSIIWRAWPGVLSSAWWGRPCFSPRDFRDGIRPFSMRPWMEVFLY